MEFFKKKRPNPQLKETSMSIKISIIGAAGTLGSCTAYRLATEGLADELIMIDVNRNMLKSHIMDLQIALAGLQNVDIREGKADDLAGSDIVINNAGAPWRVVSSRMEKLQENLPIIAEWAAKIATYCPEAVVITSTNPVDPLNLAMHKFSGLNRKKLLGYTLNDSTRFIHFSAQVLGVETTRVQGSVIGEHGDYAVLLFSSLQLDGKPVSIDNAIKADIRSRHRNYLKTAIGLGTGWTSGWASSIGLAAMVSAITGKTDVPIPCSFLLQGEYGFDGICMSVPAELSLDGVQKVIELELTPDEKKALEESAAYLQGITAEMKTHINK
jgi:malate/lactate dehydrogenase